MRFSREMGVEASDPAVRMFAQRSLDIEVATRLGAQYLPDQGAYRFPYDGFSKFRGLKKNFWIEPKGARLRLWNVEGLRELPSRPSEPLVITEGEFDAIAVAQACGGYVVSVPNGVAGKRSEGEIVIAEDNRFAYLWEGERLIQEVEQFDKIILCTDGDEPGLILRDELALRIGETRCWYVTYPDGCKDANDVLQIHGKEGLQALLDGAKPMRPGHLVRPEDVPPKANIQSFSTGWPFLDKHLKFERPELLVVTGEPNHGKGQFVRCLTFNLAEAHGWRTAFLTPEDPAHRVKRDMERFSRRKYKSELMAGVRTWDATPEQLQAAHRWVNDHFLISMPPEDEPITIDMVEREMESAALHHNCQVFVLDPWNEIEHEWRRGENETQYIERTLRRLLRKTRRLNLLLVICAHPTKIGEGEKVTLYKISGAAHWRNKCQHGLIIRKPDPNSNGIEVEIEKSKDWENMGRPGIVDMEFDVRACDYKEV